MAKMPEVVTPTRVISVGLGVGLGALAAYGVKRLPIGPWGTVGDLTSQPHSSPRGYSQYEAELADEGYDSEGLVRDALGYAFLATVVTAQDVGHFVKERTTEAFKSAGAFCVDILSVPDNYELD